MMIAGVVAFSKSEWAATRGHAATLVCATTPTVIVYSTRATQAEVFSCPPVTREYKWSPDRLGREWQFLAEGGTCTRN